jgi:hypothetical protein
VVLALLAGGRAVPASGAGAGAGSAGSSSGGPALASPRSLHCTPPPAGAGPSSAYPLPPASPRRYEGLTREAIAHGMGVMTFGNGTGGGFHLREVSRGDK